MHFCATSSELHSRRNKSLYINMLYKILRKGVRPMSPRRSRTNTSIASRNVALDTFQDLSIALDQAGVDVPRESRRRATASPRQRNAHLKRRSDLTLPVISTTVHPTAHSQARCCWRTACGTKLLTENHDGRWRREWDSNPRYGFPHTRFPSVRLKPLGHPSERPLMTAERDFCKRGLH